MSRLLVATAALEARARTLTTAEAAAKVAYQALPKDSPDGLLEHAYEAARVEREESRRMYSLMSIRRDRLAQGKAI